MVYIYKQGGSNDHVQWSPVPDKNWGSTGCKQASEHGTFKSTKPQKHMEQNTLLEYIDDILREKESKCSDLTVTN